MNTRLALFAAALCCAVLLYPAARPTAAQQAASTATSSWISDLAFRYALTPDVTYMTANNYDDKLDVYVPPGNGPFPTLLYMHGGGWTNGTKDASGPGGTNPTAFVFLPFIEKGWAVVNVEYRVARISLAPAAVEDCRCALRWTIQHAKEYKFDTNRVVAMGNSSGGHLALTTGMLPSLAGLDRQCPGAQELKVAAILDFYGITDVNELLDGPNMRPFAVTWLGSVPDRDQVAKRVSPLTYVRAGLPPIMMIQGDADPTVPYTQSVRLQKALDVAGVPNELVTIPGGKHGQFSRQEMDMIYTHVWAFLGKYLPKAGS